MRELPVDRRMEAYVGGEASLPELPAQPDFDASHGTAFSSLGERQVLSQGLGSLGASRARVSLGNADPLTSRRFETTDATALPLHPRSGGAKKGRLGHGDAPGDPKITHLTPSDQGFELREQCVVLERRDKQSWRRSTST